MQYRLILHRRIDDRWNWVCLKEALLVLNQKSETESVSSLFSLFVSRINAVVSTNGAEAF